MRMVLAVAAAAALMGVCGTTSRFLLSVPINASLGCVCFGFGRLAIMFSVINNDYGGGLFAVKVIVVI